MSEPAATAPSSSSADGIISPETSQRVCRHMNDDHALTVYAMARRRLEETPPPPAASTSSSAPGKITDATLTQVTADACHIRAVTCSGDVCAVQTLTVPLVPPLTRASELKPRLVALHHDVLTPRWQWIWTKPFALKFLLTFAALAYGAVGMGPTALTAALDETRMIRLFYRHTAVMAWILVAVFYVTLAAHVGEALYAVYVCRTQLQLRWGGTLRWALLVVAVGYPMWQELAALQEYAKRATTTTTSETTETKKDS